MPQFGTKLNNSTTIRRRFHQRVSLLRRCILRVLHRILLCSGRKTNNTYSMLPPALPSPPLPTTAESAGEIAREEMDVAPPAMFQTHDLDSDLVSLKISLLGDCQIGKTSFLVKYVGDEKEKHGSQMEGLNQMDKTLVVKGVRISYCIWEVQGDGKTEDRIPMACTDSVAILIMFDLTSRCTLNSVLGWYKEARKWNQTAIPVLIGTKFDDFIQLPIDLQWTIANEARKYAKALNAALFFSSATYNINVNKIFKFITAKLFDLPWKVERNLNVGEPIIDF
ncbi:septum-promoting GTP-binding protein 1 [Vigna radiata var. radiata]|uniref:Septum-promoting GTP-binding protein 1 n=1 Tax=Vigna radiata var. radiata TaxID=3916 RepID=A0A1S3TI37_VIGRR|nr:septum-promoting GTP-binding protein 1 [Vigna radiata var. radiata]